MKRIGRRQFLGALAGSMALLPMKKIFSQRSAVATAAAKGAAGAKPLRAAIVYYSATGNTAKVAMAIHRGMKSSMHCDLIKVKKANPRKMAQYDVIGIGGPIWFYRDTANLKLFIHKMPDMSGKLCFPFCTHGEEPIGFFESIWDSLAKKNFTIIGWNDWYGSVYQVLHMPKPYLTDGHPDSIDLLQAEDFGREMANRAQRYTAGEKITLPAIPQGPDADPLWIRHDLPEAQHGPGPKTGSRYGDGAVNEIVVGGVAAAIPARAATKAGANAAPKPGAGQGGGPGGMPGGGPGGSAGPRPGGPGGGPGGPGGPFGSMKKVVPQIEMATCVYPRCDACIFGCPVNAIDMSLAVSVDHAPSQLVVKEACISCGLCERMCIYDAITFAAIIPKSQHEIDMKKCTYPECKLCVDHCPMNSIDFSTRPPTFHNDCEGCDLCFVLCPYNAISIPNLAKAQIPLAQAASGPNSPFVRFLAEYEKAGRFRRLVPLDKVGWGHQIYKNKNVPRIVLNKYDEATYCYKACKVEDVEEEIRRG